MLIILVKNHAIPLLSPPTPYYISSTRANEASLGFTIKSRRWPVSCKRQHNHKLTQEKHRRNSMTRSQYQAGRSQKTKYHHYNRLYVRRRRPSIPNSARSVPPRSTRGILRVNATLVQHIPGVTIHGNAEKLLTHDRTFATAQTPKICSIFFSFC